MLRKQRNFWKVYDTALFQIYSLTSETDHYNSRYYEDNIAESVFDQAVETITKIHHSETRKMFNKF